LISSVGQIFQPDSLVNQGGIAGLPSKIAQAIRTAAARTGVDFSYLVQKASQESGFDPNAKASSSSATGLFQFTNQTWLQMVKNRGADYGLGTDADKISIDSNGYARVSDPVARQAILGLRNDPQISAEMAGELDKQNFDHLQENVGGKIGGTELYLAHFLGAGGASSFLNKMRANPDAQAASVLPDAANANPSVFYNNAGQPRSLSQIYQHFAQKFGGEVTTMVASMQSQTRTPQPQTAASSAATLAAPNPSVMVPTATYSVARAAYDPSMASSYVAATMNSIKTNTSNAFTTMVLAQMMTPALPATPTGESLDPGEKTRKNAPSILGMIA
jgi:hypothetical protein